MRVCPHDPLPSHEDCETLPASGVLTVLRSGSLCSLVAPGDSARRVMPSGLTIQTFGDRINLHVHLHFLVNEGGMDEAAVSPVLMNRKRFMSAGVFQKIPRIDDSRPAIYYRHGLGGEIHRQERELNTTGKKENPFLNSMSRARLLQRS